VSDVFDDTIGHLFASQARAKGALRNAQLPGNRISLFPIAECLKVRLLGCDQRHRTSSKSTPSKPQCHFDAARLPNRDWIRKQYYAPIRLDPWAKAGLPVIQELR